MTFTPNRTFVDELARERAVKRVLEDGATSALRFAQAIAQPFQETGRYAESLQADGNRLLSTDPAAHLIEWGSINNPAYAPLRKAVEQTGARYVDTGRA